MECSFPRHWETLEGELPLVPLFIHFGSNIIIKNVLVKLLSLFKFRVIECSFPRVGYSTKSHLCWPSSRLHICRVSFLLKKNLLTKQQVSCAPNSIIHNTHVAREQLDPKNTRHVCVERPKPLSFSRHHRVRPPLLGTRSFHERTLGDCETVSLSRVFSRNGASSRHSCGSKNIAHCLLPVACRSPVSHILWRRARHDPRVFANVASRTHD